MAIAQLRRITEADIRALRKIVGPEHVRVGNEISDDYAAMNWPASGPFPRYWSNPDAARGLGCDALCL